MGAEAFFETPVSQSTGMPVEQHASTSAPRFVKATFYLTPEQVLRLERLRLARREQGERIDKSALVREAIDRL
jgi:hypothetical protein